MEIMSSENPVVEGFGEVEQDAIGEIQNITMGSAATAVSNLLGAKVWITTPQVSVVQVKNLSYPDLEPSIHVTIQYIKGISGSSVLVLKQNDVQLILNQLMGQPLVVTDDFEFDEMNISAVCEVMNQMMGASATALSELIDTPIDISTPVAEVHDASAPFAFEEEDVEKYVCQIKFNITIDGVINSEFITVLTIDLAKAMADKMLEGYGSALDSASADNSITAGAEEMAAQNPDGKLSQEQIEAMLSGGKPAADPAPSSGGGTLSQEEIEALMNGGAASQAVSPDLQMPPPSGQAMPNPQAAYNPQMPNPQAVPNMQAAPGMQQMPNGAVPAYGYPPQYDPNMQYGMPPQYGYPQQQMYMQPNVNVRPAQLKSFEDYNSPLLNKDENDNLKLLMNIPLNVTVELGSTTKKVKEILEFQQGTIIELERQAGAPVDVIVNGNLIAKGDVVVIGDNFAVRITEIVKNRLLETIGEKNGK